MIPEALRDCFNAIVLNAAIFSRPIAVSNVITVLRPSNSSLNWKYAISATTDLRKRVVKYFLHTFRT